MSLPQHTAAQKQSEPVLPPHRNLSEDSEVRQDFSQPAFPACSRGCLLSRCSLQWPVFPSRDTACNEIKMEGQPFSNLLACSSHG